MSPPVAPGGSWESDIRTREEEARAAFLHADVESFAKLCADGLVVNSPLLKVLGRQQVLDALKAGRIRHDAYEIEIEHVSRNGDMVVVMGRDRVVEPPDGTIARRRFTNVWTWEHGAWRMAVRHAQVVSREPGVSNFPQKA